LDKNTSIGLLEVMGGAQYSLVTHVYTGTIDGGAFAVTEAGEVTANAEGGGALGLVSRSAPETRKTDAEGKITFSLSTNDPNPLPTSLEDARTVVYVLTPVPNANAPAVDSADLAGTRPSGYVVFAEAASAVTTVRVESIGSYAELKARASSPAASHGVTVTVLDQYGRPMRNQAVTLTSTGSQNSDTSVPGSRRTGSTGSVRIFYSHDGTTAWTETITATWNAGTPNDATDDKTGATDVHWAQRTSEPASTGTPNILAASLANDEVIVTGPTLVRYDDNDIFATTVPVAAGGTGLPVYLDAEGFEALLATIIDPANQALADGATGKRSGSLTWSGYDHDDEDLRTLFTFALSVA